MNRMCVCVCFALAAGCGGDDSAVCPDSLATNAAEWQAPAGAREQCGELARALNASGVDVGGGDAGDCSGSTNQTESGGQCRATIASSCDGLSFELRCIVQRDRTADCDVTIDAPELDGACALRVHLR